MEQTVKIYKAYYMCGCTKEHLSNDHPKICPLCYGYQKCELSRVETFQAKRTIEYNTIVYPECG